MELAKAFDPKLVEPKWVARWGGVAFRADPTSPKEPFAVVMPPPNVTGDLHLGHALDNTIIDVLARQRRMAGCEVLYLPGTDHAGISTQVVVERELAAEGVSRHQLGREAFLERVWDWRARSGGRISLQLRRLGLSCDWSRERFTLDSGLSRAVRYQFVALYHRGLIYRGERMVNWDPKAQTTLSDLEVEREERSGQMYLLRYLLEDPTLPLSNGGAGEILVATVRPETIFADQAIAVHPRDPRFAHLIGRSAKIPLTDRWIPILSDPRVDPDFGVGALKITPAHDPTDYEIGRDHGLGHPSVIDLEGRMCSELVPGFLRGLDRFEARSRVVEALGAAGLLQETRPHRAALAVSERTGVVVEPLLSTQWFVRTEPLAQLVLGGLDRGDMTFVPERWLKVDRDWLTSLRDWNISRQLWWGHRIPAWYAPDGTVHVPPMDRWETDPPELPELAGVALVQDPDVFDTWFSSNLWPMSTLGWPDPSQDFARFYPNALLVTGYDILFFWVARMQMAGYGLTGSSPFPRVLLHGLYLDRNGQKMSKSKRNGIDPLDLLDSYGADATRFALVALATGGQDIRHDPRRFEQGQHFANKVWNVSRFALRKLEELADATPLPPALAAWRVGIELGRPSSIPEQALEGLELELADRWVLERLSSAVAELDAGYAALDLAKVAQLLYRLVWEDFCDWYVEVVKLTPLLPARATVLLYVLERLLRLLHPVMPFLTAELSEALFGTDVAQAPWPSQLAVSGASELFTQLQAVVAAARNLRSELGLAPGDRLSLHLEGELGAWPVTLLEGLARAEVEVGAPGPSLAQVVSGFTLRAPLRGQVDLGAWAEKQRRRLSQLQAQLRTSQQRLSSPDFLDKAPSQRVAEERARLEDLSAQDQRLRSLLSELGEGNLA